MRIDLSTSGGVSTARETPRSPRLLPMPFDRQTISGLAAIRIRRTCRARATLFRFPRVRSLPRGQAKIDTISQLVQRRPVQRGCGPGGQRHCGQHVPGWLTNGLKHGEGTGAAVSGRSRRQSSPCHRAPGGHALRCARMSRSAQRSRRETPAGNKRRLFRYRSKRVSCRSAKNPHTCRTGPGAARFRGGFLLRLGLLRGDRSSVVHARRTIASR
jgi:hypothetical protein